MATLRDIKERIAAVKGTAKITSAMKMVAAAKLKRAQNAIESARPYVSKLESMVGNLVSDLGESYSHNLLKSADEVKSVAIVVVSSDRGLCGSFNTNLFKSVVSFINEDLKIKYPNAVIKIMPVGRKSCDFFRKQNFEIIAQYPGVFTNLKFESAKIAVDLLKKDFALDNIDVAVVYYNSFINMLRQVPKQNQILPVLKTEKLLGNTSVKNVDYIFEPDKKQILDVLLPKLVDIQLWRALLESNAAEQASKMMAMEKATTNAKELITNLELVYNKARQAAITTEMLEIVSGAEALNKG